MEKAKLIIVAGPTASGKSALGVRLAQALDGEIISADSMQVYRGMDIGTAKIRPEETGGIPHHLIDCVEPWEEWNVMEFTGRARRTVEEILSRGHQPIVVGGTGFYIHALAYGAEFGEEPETDIRARLEQEEAGELYRRLSELDPEGAAAIHPNNKKRVIRALEYFYQTGEPISRHNARLRSFESPYDLRLLVLEPDRAELYRRIDERVDAMMAEGLLEEVRGLMARGFDRRLVSMQGLGYKELAAYLAGECSLEEAVYQIKLGTRHYAKRQLTWFRRESEARFLPVSDPVSLFSEALAVCQYKS